MHPRRLLAFVISPLPERARAWAPPGVERWLLLVLAAMLLPLLPLVFQDGREWIDGGIVSTGEPTVGDYDIDAGPALDRVRDGRLWQLYGGQHPPLMMPLSLLVRLPALAIGQTELDEYRAGVVLVMLGAAATAWVFAEWWQRAAWVVLLNCNPLTWEAIRYGHPEEVLLGALVVTAMVLAVRGRAIGAGVVLGLAIATKQPAVFAVGPVLLASPQRLRTLGAAALVALAVIAPFIGPHLPMMLAQQRLLATGHEQMSAALAPSVWTLAGGEWTALPPEHEWSGGGYVETALPSWLVLGGRMWAVIIAASLAAVMVSIAYRRGIVGAAVVTAAWSLLASGLALRVALDPNATAYYAVPLLAVVLAVGLTRGLPIVIIVALVFSALMLQVASQAAIIEALFTPADGPFGPWYANAWLCGVTMVLGATAATLRGFRALLHKTPVQAGAKAMRRRTFSS